MIRQTFTSPEPFAAMEAAELWCRDNGICYGEAQRNDPRGLRWGNASIGKWRNLSKHEKGLMHGRMTGDMRLGPVAVCIVEREKVNA